MIRYIVSGCILVDLEYEEEDQAVMGVIEFVAMEVQMLDKVGCR